MPPKKPNPSPIVTPFLFRKNIQPCVSVVSVSVLIVLLRVTTQYNDLETDEINILTGALRLKQKCVKVEIFIQPF